MIKKEVEELMREICGPDFAPYHFLKTDLFKGTIRGGHNIYYKKGKDDTEGIVLTKSDIRKFGLDNGAFPTNFVTDKHFSKSSVHEGWTGEEAIKVLKHIKECLDRE